MTDASKMPKLADSPATPEELRQALTEADSLLSLIGYRMAERIGLDLAEEAKAASARCRALAERVAFHGAKRDGTRGSESEGIATEVLDEVEQALQKSYHAALTLSGMDALNVPYPDDPRWTPWTRWLSPAARRAHDARQRLRRARESQLPSSPENEA